MFVCVCVCVCVCAFVVEFVRTCLSKFVETHKSGRTSFSSLCGALVFDNRTVAEEMLPNRVCK